MTVFSHIHTTKRSKYKSTVESFIPRTVFVPLNQDDDEDFESLVKEGEHVEEGQLLAKKEYSDGLFYKAVYSPVPGTVKGFLLTPSPNGKMTRSVQIDLQGSFTYTGKRAKNLKAEGFSPEQIIRTTAEHGILNTFASNKPVLLARQLEQIKNDSNKLIVVRLFDEDPSRIIDGVITRLFLSKIIEGIKILIKAIEADGIILVTDKSFEKPEIFNPFQIPMFFLKVNSKLYPAASINSICTETRKKAKSMPFSAVSKYSLFTDSSTMLELYKCMTTDKHVTSRLIHVSGDCLPASGIVSAYIGMTFRELAAQCGGFIQNPAAIIVNGMITGVSAGSLDASVTKSVKSVTFLPKMQCPSQKQYTCIKCGACRRSCPIKLSPDILYRHIVGAQTATLDYVASSAFCTGCGLCNSSCPSRLPLAQRIIDFSIRNAQKTEADS